MTDLFENYGERVDELLKFYKDGARTFKRVTLSQSRFSNVALVKADFSHSNFASAEFENVDLSEAIFRGSDLSYTKILNSNLSKTDLRGVDLEHTIICNANLQDANLDRANLSHASLKSNNLRDVNLEQALLKGANLADACLQNANLTLANLAMANLLGTDLRAANLDRAILINAVYSTTTRFPEGFDPVRASMKIAHTDTSAGEQLLNRYRMGERDFRRIGLTRAYLEKADLRGADFSGADLTKVDLRFANLQGVILKGANLGYASLSGADLTGADLRGATLSHCQFKQGILARANLDRANFRGANLAKTNLSGTSLEQASLMGVNLRNANLDNANLRNTNLTEANLTEANLTRANLCGVDLRIATIERAVFEGAQQSKTTRWPDGFDPHSAGVKSSDRSVESTNKLTSPLISERSVRTKVTPLAPSSRNADFLADPAGVDDSQQRSFAFRPTISLAFGLLAFATLAGVGYSVSTLLQPASIGSNEGDSISSSTDSSVGDSKEVSLPLDSVFGDRRLDGRFERAVEHRKNGELREAITLLQSIPEGNRDYELAQDTVNVWQWEFDRQQVDSARGELDRQNWQTAVEETEAIFNDYWKAEARPIADRARYRLALEALERGDFEKAKSTANLISDEVQHQNILAEIEMQSPSDNSPLPLANAEVSPNLPPSDPKETLLPEVAQLESSLSSNDSISESALTSTNPAAIPEPLTIGTKGRMIWPEGLAILSEPGGAYIGGIPFNETVTILAFSGDGRWQRVRREASGQEGWVKAGNIEKVEPMAAADPAVSNYERQGASPQLEAASPNPAEGEPQTLFGGDRGRNIWPEGLAMRSAPGGEYIGGIPFNETVTILELSGDGRWQRVRREATGQEGWVKAGNIENIR